MRTRSTGLSGIARTVQLGKPALCALDGDAGPLIIGHCAAIPRDLIASELFGHEKGVFTGATQRRLGRFESADGGTIFLDEIGELPAEMQIALRRVLQEREFQRVGGNESLKSDCG